MTVSGSNNLPTDDGSRAERSKTWTKARLQLLSWLKFKSPGLAELYEGSVTVIHDLKLPGRGIYVCHAVREIRNRLPDILAGGARLGWTNYKNLLDGIDKEWIQHGVGGERLAQGEQAGSSSPADTVSIPRSVYDMIEGLLKDHRAAPNRKIQNATRMFESQDGDGKFFGAQQPAIDQWLGVTKWFEDQAHFQGTITDDQFDWPVLTENFGLFEQTLFSLSREFFEHKTGGLDEILEQANR